MKEIPTSFCVICYTVHVKRIPANEWTHSDDNCVGYFDTSNSTIYLKERATEELTRQIFWHEVVHTALFAINHPLYTDETFVDNMGALLTQIMETAR